MNRRITKIVILVIILFSFQTIKGQSKEGLMEAINQNIIHGDYKECKKACLRFINLYGHNEKDPNLNIVRTYLAFSDIQLGYKDNGLTLLQQAEKSMNKLLDSQSIDYARWLGILASTYKLIDYRKSLDLLGKEIDLYEDLEQYKSQGYVMALIQICQIYFEQKINASAAVDQILEKLLPLAKEVCGETSLEYNVSLLTAVKNAESKGNAVDPIKYSDEFLKVANASLQGNPYIKSFVYHSRLRAFLAAGQYDKALSEAQYYGTIVKDDCMSRYALMTSDERVATMGYIQDWFFDGLSRLAMAYPVNSTATMTYDGLLFAKGLLQNLEFIEEGSGNRNILSIEWSQVRNALKPGEAAIEFVAYNNPNALFPTYYYTALVIKSGYESPHIIKMDPITFIDEEDRIGKQCKALWKPLLEELNGIRTLYFSAFGHIHNMPIESFLPEQLTGIKVYRLSSTRQLVLDDYNTGKSAAIFGGLKYDMSIAEMLNTSLNRESEDILPFLKGTLEEANNIINLLNSSKNQLWEAKPFIGKDGTESSFKMLSRKKTRVIHLATHGFYYNKPLNEYTDYVQIALSHNYHSLEDKPLTRSGLYMAGANNTYNGREIPQGVDDGVLTAQEISCLDLRGLDLVVLSACQTAEGDISGEGVLGLQRGFKKAGAKSILMSLWKVDDEATCFLMTEFYKKWICEGKSKYQALELAKQEVRSRKGWEDPKYWAAFILLDGLD